MPACPGRGGRRAAARAGRRDIPESRAFSEESARELLAFVVRANAAALAGRGEAGGR